MAGRHTPAQAQKSAPTKRRSARRPIVSAAAGIVALAVAACLVIPVGAASAKLPTTVSFVNTHTQAMDVADDVTITSPTRDGSTVSHVVGSAGPSLAVTGDWVAPISAAITSGFGPRAPICTAGGCSSSFHKGDDFAIACNTPFYAASAGTVLSAGVMGTLGYTIVVLHPGGIETYYSHMFATGVLVSQGDRVSAGQNIGLVGSSGDSTGCHLYFQYNLEGTPIDPVIAMASHGITLG